MEKFTADGAKLKKLRKSKKINQSAIDGVSDRTVRLMEKGEPVGKGKALMVALALGLDISDFAPEKPTSIAIERVVFPPLDLRNPPYKWKGDSESWPLHIQRAYPITSCFSFFQSDLREQKRIRYVIWPKEVGLNRHDPDGREVSPLKIIKQIEEALSKLQKCYQETGETEFRIADSIDELAADYKYLDEIAAAKAEVSYLCNELNKIHLQAYTATLRDLDWHEDLLAQAVDGNGEHNFSANEEKLIYIIYSFDQSLFEDAVPYIELVSNEPITEEIGGKWAQMESASYGH